MRGGRSFLKQKCITSGEIYIDLPIEKKPVVTSSIFKASLDKSFARFSTRNPPNKPEVKATLKASTNTFTPKMISIIGKGAGAVGRRVMV